MNPFRECPWTSVYGTPEERPVTPAPMTPTELGRAIADRVIGGMSVADIISELAQNGPWGNQALYYAMIEAHYTVNASESYAGVTNGTTARLQNEVNLVLLGLARKET